jgi:hypothetical protein
LWAKSEKRGELVTRASLGEHGGIPLMVWACFIELLKAEGAPGAKAATWKGDGHERANK